jgi:ketosteroid isomerase-like protein
MSHAGFRDEGPTMDREAKLDILRDIAHGFDTHDLDRIMRHFAENAVFESPRGRDPWGTRLEGIEAVRSAFAARFDGIPDVRYQGDDHFVDGDRGASQWTLSGTTTDGQRIEIRGCDLWTFRDGQIVKKDSYWKIRTE